MLKGELDPRLSGLVDVEKPINGEELFGNDQELRESLREAELTTRLQKSKNFRGQ